MLCDRTNREPKTMQHHYFLTHVIDERQQLVHSTSYLTVLVPLSSALFCICTRTTPDTFSTSSTTNFNFTTFQQGRPDRDAHCRIPCPPNMDCPMCDLHPPPMHAHCTRITSRGCYERRKRAKGANLHDFPRRYKKCRSVS